MSNRNTFVRLFLALALALLVSSGVWAQSTGSIIGTITDAGGAVVPNASVTVLNAGTGDAKTTKAGSGGEYQFLQLLPGSYKITVESAGFKQFIRAAVDVTVNNATRIDAAMATGAVSEMIEVTTESPLVNTQSSSLNYEVGTKQIDALPLNGRNVMNLTALVPGVVPQGNTSGNPATQNVNGWGNYQIGGGAANQSQTLIDGGPLNISYTNSTSLVLTQDMVQEFQVSTNNVSPEFGRFAGGVVNMATKSGTNDLHGTLYEYYRNAAFNANLYFNKHNPVNLINRPVYTQHQFGAAGGGPIVKDRTFAFLSWEQFSLRQAATTTTTVPSAAFLAGDFSSICTSGFTNSLCNTASQRLYDPITKTTGGARVPFANNQIPVTRLNDTAIRLAQILFPTPTNAALTNNFAVSNPSTTVFNQYNARVDHRLNAKNQIFARFTNWHKNTSGTSALRNQIGNNAYYGTIQTVVGDSFTLTPNLVGQVRASYLRFKRVSVPFLCCNFQESQLGGNWASYQSAIRLAQAPQPNITGFNNFSTGATTFDTDNAYVLSGSLTYTHGRHSIQFGGESRRIEWGYVQSNSPGATFTFDSGFTAAATGSTGGYSFASYMLGYPSAGSAQEPKLSLGTMYYSGAFIADSFRLNKKLTINAGLRWEQPGSFHERNGSLSTLDLTRPTTLPSVGGQATVGGLALVSSDRQPSRNWQNLHWALFSPRLGFAYSPNEKSVLRAGFGISYLPNTVAFSLGPYNNPPNSATTTMNTSTNGNADPNQATTLSNPFPAGILQPPGRNQAALDSLIGQGIQSPASNSSSPYTEQYNIGVQHQFGGGLVIDAGYVGSHGVSLPLYSYNHNQLPYASIALGKAANAVQVPNPFFGRIPATSVLGGATINAGYLAKPFPQYLYVTEDAPSIAGSKYNALQVRVEERFHSAGVLLVSYTHAHLEGTADTLTGYLESSRFGVGGASGVQDNNNIAAEYSKSSFDVPDRAVISYTLGLPFGRGRKFLNNTNGFVNRLVGDWKINGIVTFQSGFPLAFQYSSPNTLQTLYAKGDAGPGLPAGVSRPDYVQGCAKSIDASPKDKLTKYFNTACFVKSDDFAFGNEPRVDPDLRAQGISNLDASIAKKVSITERVGFEFRAESFNLLNRTQFAPPNAQVDVATYGTVVSQVNQPRLLQLSGRVNF